MLNFQRVRQQNFYYARYNNQTILKSYNTIVGIIIDNQELFEVKYSRTTSKQVSQFCNIFPIATKYKNVVSANDLHDIIKSTTGLDLNTNYNCA